MNTLGCLLGGKHAWRLMEALCAPLPYPVHCISSIWLFLSCDLYNKPVNVSKVFFWVLWVILASIEPEEGVVFRLIAGRSDVQWALDF